ncbi:MAG: BlaI/MecI/CopY family transcriptional regulator [Oscillospiraceae bacterium]|nr:BlaI/MecI/CopY family transcriptional regulator [Oscillospiraceae bacterium]
MNNKQIALTEAEWMVMECLWEKSPRTGRETVDWLNRKMGWTRSTTLTMLRRLEAKGAVAGDTERELKTFCPLIAREEVAVRETENLLERAYKGSLSLLVSSLTKKQSLPQKEIDELYAILREMEGKHGD